MDNLIILTWYQNLKAILKTHPDINDGARVGHGRAEAWLRLTETLLGLREGGGLRDLEAWLELGGIDDGH